MIEFSSPSEEFKRKNPHIFGAGKVTASGPAPSKEDLREERTLQVQILNLLRLNGIEPLWHRTDKKSHATVGWPDFTFSAKSIPVLWEIKLPGRKLSKDQERMRIKLTDPSNGWTYRVITSVDEALTELRKLGIS